MECTVCYSAPHKVKCPYCEHLTCVQCQKTFLTGITKDAHCMNCNKLWDRSTLVSLLPRTFVTGKLKEYRESILFEREQGLMPATQPEVVRIKVQTEINALVKGFKEEARKKPGRKGERPPELNILRQFQINFIARTTGQGRPEKKVVKLVRKCPCTGCKGFLNSKWKCELCSMDICKECNETVECNHTCDPEIVETMKLIRSDTKGCPTCGTLIYRSSGCPQMWCVECHTTFDWNTGEIETGVVHNPHYYEFQRRNGTLARNPGDVCGGDGPNIYQLVGFGNDAMDIHRCIVHIQRYYTLQVHQDPNRKNRIAYMLGHIDDDQFKFRIQCSEKAREKHRDICNILDMFTTVATDLLQTLLVNRDVEMFKVACVNLTVYSNEALTRIREVYKTNVPRIVDGDIKLK
jgi:hypothetical protein